MTNLLDAALALHAAGLAVIPTRTNGSKAPAVDWKTIQDHPENRPDVAQLHAWFTPTPANPDDPWAGHTPSYDGLGVVCGAASGHLEMLELEGRAEHLGPQLQQLMADHDLADLWAHLCGGYLERSPSGGYHWLYRVSNGPAHPNTKLARRPATDTELEEWKHREREAAARIESYGQRLERMARIDATRHDQVVQVMIETRGEGGFTVTAPSAGRTHPSGRPWVLLAGGPATIPTITAEERDSLHAICRLLDQMPAPQPAAPPAPSSAPTGGTGAAGPDLRPGDDYNQRTTWDDILVPHGWTRGRRIGTGHMWTRPGKNPGDGYSATTGTHATPGDPASDRLYVFTTSTLFDTDTPYTKFGAYALLEHNGDHAEAARQLRGKGYGSPIPERPALTLLPGGRDTPPPEAGTPPASTDDARSSAPVDGTAALQPEPATTVADSEDAHAHRLIATYGTLIRYNAERGRWLVWSGSRWAWQPPGGGLVREYAKVVARRLTDRDANLTQRRRALSSAGITGALKQAETDERVAVSLANLDHDPWILNTPAGAVDLHTGNIHPPAPESLCTRTTTAAPDNTPDPAWEKFLADTFGDDTETRDYMQRLVGITLIGQVREQLLAFLHGAGANGKSTLAEALMHALGTGETGYATAAPSEMLMIRRHEAHPAELAQLAGARMVVCSELDDGQRFAESKIKHLTGRDSINARFLYGQPFTFAPTHTIWLLGNHRPQARTGGEAFWRRVKLIEFPNVVPTHLRDPALGDRLNAAAGTILTWAIAGAVDYAQHGIREPAAVTAASKAYADDQDTIGRFVADSCHRAGSDLVRVAMPKLRAAYEAWCRESGEEPASPRRFGTELRDRFDVGEAKSSGRKFYTRIALLEPDPDDEPEGEHEQVGRAPDGLPWEPLWTPGGDQ